MRFLRRKYKDPLTGKDDWKPVLYGQAHVRPLGFFGQPLMTAGLAGTASMYAAPRPLPPTRMAYRSRARFRTGDRRNEWASGLARHAFLGLWMDVDRWAVAAGSRPHRPPPGSTTTSPFGSSGTGTSATTFGGGGPIVGFTLPVDKPSLIEYKLQKRYNKWEFNYDPMEDQAMGLTGLGGTGTPTLPNNSNSPLGGNNSGNNTPFGGNNNGGPNGPGAPVTPPTSPTSPTDPTAPQQ